MKKIFIVIMLLFVMIFPITVNAEELDDSTIIKFDSYPGGSLSSKRDLTFVWTSSAKMEDLVIKIYLPESEEYKEVFNSNWDLESEEEDFDVEFEIINEPIDDPETEDIDESFGKSWTYKVTFLVEEQTLGVLKFIFEYKACEKEYKNIFYMSNIVYPTPTPQPDQDDIDESIDNSTNIDNEADASTRHALTAAVFACACSLIGTVLIIFSSQTKKNEDEGIM